MTPTERAIVEAAIELVAAEDATEELIKANEGKDLETIVDSDAFRDNVLRRREARQRLYEAVRSR